MPLIQYISRILFDFGAISALGEERERLGVTRPLLITDKGVANAGHLQRALDTIGTRDVQVYDDTTENPTEASLLDCLEVWHDKGCDGVVALGGGSSIDLAKAVALLTSHPGSLADYGVKTGGSDKIGTVTKHLAIPTTAGTGAEIGRASVMTLLDGTKSVAVNLNLVANTVICDPELTLTLPPRLTAATGIDALSHGIEAACSGMINPPAEAIAVDCVARAAAWLRPAVEDGDNREARWQMMMAALEGGMSLQKSLGAAHAMANPLGELNLHHGTLIGVLLPHAIRFNRDHASDILARLSKAAHVPKGEDFADWVERLVADIDLPGNLGTLGVTAAEVDQNARKAAQDHLSASNPRLAGVEDYLRLLTAAL